MPKAIQICILHMEFCLKDVDIGEKPLNQTITVANKNGQFLTKSALYGSFWTNINLFDIY